ncbi:MAG: hypothetical protein ACJ79P_13370, partial [Myxococcales bacterium]
YRDYFKGLRLLEPGDDLPLDSLYELIVCDGFDFISVRLLADRRSSAMGSMRAAGSCCRILHATSSLNTQLPKRQKSPGSQAAIPRRARIRLGDR